MNSWHYCEIWSGNVILQVTTLLSVTSFNCTKSNVTMWFLFEVFHKCTRLAIYNSRFPHTYTFFTVYTKLTEMVIMASKDLTTRWAKQAFACKTETLMEFFLIQQIQWQKIFITTRMHSCGMRTARFSCRLRKGGVHHHCMLGYTHAPMNRMTDRCKNITLPQTLFAGGNKSRTFLYIFCIKNYESIFLKSQSLLTLWNLVTCFTRFA